MGKRNTLPLNRGPDGPQSWSGQFGKEKNFVPTRIETRLVDWLISVLLDGAWDGWLVVG
jgi:hypothetical protein